MVINPRNSHQRGPVKRALKSGADEPTTIGKHNANKNAVFSTASGNRFDNYEIQRTTSTTCSVYLLKTDETINTRTLGNYGSFGTVSYC